MFAGSAAVADGHKDATAKVAECTKEHPAPGDGKPLTDLREATCTQVELVCKPAAGEPG